MARYYLIKWTLVLNSGLAAGLIFAEIPNHNYIISEKKYNKPAFLSAEPTSEAPNYDQSNRRARSAISQSSERLNDNAGQSNVIPYGEFQKVMHPEDKNNINFNTYVNNGERTLNIGNSRVQVDNYPFAKGQKNHSLNKSPAGVIGNDNDTDYLHISKEEPHRTDDNLIKLRSDEKKFNSGRHLIGYVYETVCSLLRNNENQWTCGRHNIVGNIVDNVKYTTQVVLEGLLKVGLIGIQIGSLIIRPPLLAADKLVTTISYVNSLGKDQVTKLVNEVGSSLQNGWESVTALQLPGWNVIMFFPNGLISIVNSVYLTTWYLTSTTLSTISAAKAYAIYVVLNIISSALGPALRTVGLSCIPLKPLKLHVGMAMVEYIHSSSGVACGISYIEAINKVKVTTDDENFLIIKVPYLIKNLLMSFDNTTVSGLFGNHIEGREMNVLISRVRVTGKLSFRAGTLIKFFRIQLRIKKLEGFQILFDGNEETEMMDLVEKLSDVIAPMVKKIMNKKLAKYEQRIYEYVINGT